MTPVRGRTSVLLRPDPLTKGPGVHARRVLPEHFIGTLEVVEPDAGAVGLEVEAVVAFASDQANEHPRLRVSANDDRVVSAF